LNPTVSIERRSAGFSCSSRLSHSPYSHPISPYVPAASLPAALPDDHLPCSGHSSHGAQGNVDVHH
jgi:hypothetical protein